MKTVLVLISFVFLSFFLSAGVVQASIFEFLFPSLRDKGYDPTETMTAPFADVEPDATDKSEDVMLPENAVPLALPHRTSAAISEWVVTVSSEAMTFRGGDIEAEFEALKPYFSEGGYGQYRAFLKEKKLTEALEKNAYQLNAFVSDTPQLLNEGVVSGRYRWLYKVPMTVSYIKRGTNDYTGVDPVNRDMVLNIQIGRSEKANDASGMVVDRWDGKLQKLKK